MAMYPTDQCNGKVIQHINVKAMPSNFFIIFIVFFTIIILRENDLQIAFKKQELIGKPIDNIISSMDAGNSGDTRFLNELFKKLKQKDSINMELIYITKANRRIPMSFSGSIMMDNKGDVQGTILVAKDITDRKRAEVALRKSMSDLKRFNRLTAGREHRMIELKHEINELMRAAGHEQKYRILTMFDS